jgi:hypothetical protein
MIPSALEALHEDGPQGGPMDFLPKSDIKEQLTSIVADSIFPNRNPYI